MKNEIINELMPELKSLGLIDDKENVMLSEDNVRSLKRGNITEMISMQNLNINGVKIDQLDAKLSLSEGADGKKTLLVHPIYKQNREHSFLDSLENELFQKEGTHEKIIRGSGFVTDFGLAPYQDDPENKQSYFIELEKADGTKEKIWNLKIGDLFDELNKGDEISVTINAEDIAIHKVEGAAKRESIKYLFEFDKDTKSMVAIDQKKILIPETVNGQELSHEEKAQLKKGKEIKLEEGATLRTSPASSKGLSTNKIGMLASIVLDGGISYLIIKSAEAIAKKRKESDKKKDPYYGKYIESVKKVERDLQEKAKKHPDDPNIKHDLSIVKKEVSSPSANRSINSLKQKINDPDLEHNAERRELERQEFKQDHAPVNKEEHDREYKIKR